MIEEVILQSGGGLLVDTDYDDEPVFCPACQRGDPCLTNEAIRHDRLQADLDRLKKANEMMAAALANLVRETDAVMTPIREDITLTVDKVAGHIEALQIAREVLAALKANTAEVDDGSTENECEFIDRIRKESSNE